MIRIYTILQKYSKLFLLLFTIFFIIVSVTSCKLFDKEIKQDKHIAAFRYQLGRVQDSLLNSNDRIKTYEAILERIDGDEYLITPRKKNVLLIEGNIYLYNECLRIQNYKKAIDYSNVVIGIDSTLPKGYYDRGSVYQYIGCDSLALEDYNKAIMLNPGYTDAYYNRGIIYEEQEKYDLALLDYDKAIKLNPSYIADIYNNRGNVYLAIDEVDKAIEDYDRVLSIDTMSVKAYCNRAWAHYLKKDFDKALDDCNKAIAIDSVNVNAYCKRASVYEGMKEYTEAIADYKKVMELDPKDKLDTHDMAKQAIRKLRPLVPKKK